MRTRLPSRLALGLAVAALAWPAWRPLGAAQPAGRTYYAYACAESEDEVALVRFGPNGLEVVKKIPVGVFPTEIEGPHGIGVSKSGRYWYVSISHGNPFGSIHKYETGSDEWVGDVMVGLFPASLDISPTTGLLYVVNFDLYGEMKPSSVSVVETSTMTEVARVPTGIMPHGSRLNRDASRHYSVNMMDDHLVEIDALKFQVARKLPLSEHAAHMAAMTDNDGDAMKKMMAQMIQPTWATQPTPQGKVYVAGNNKNVILEVDLEKWAVTRRFENTANGPYNLDITPDGKTLVVTYKRGAAVGIWDLEAGKEVAQIKTTRTVPHGVVITPDGRYAFVTNEGVGGEPGTVEVYDLEKRARAAAVNIGKQAGGIAFWKMEP